MRAGFTMIELIFSLVIVAIIASIGTDIIRSVYDRYTASKEIERAQSDLRRALDQIANRLQYRIKNSTVARNGDDYIPINDEKIDPTYDTLEWIGIDYLSQREGHYNGYLMFDDPDLNISFITGDEVPKEGDEEETNRTIVLSFLGENYRGADYKEWGWGKDDVEANKTAYAILEENPTPISAEDIFIIKNLANEAIGIENPLFTVPQSAYALFIDKETKDGEEIRTLKLAYDYYPWISGTSRSREQAKEAILLENVASFHFREDRRGILRVVLCVKAPDQVVGDNKQIGDHNEYEAKFCRERAIL